MAKKPRDKIPPRLKREVRQRCGFGCVVCGAPIYHYEHMVDYAKELKHEAENITLLCPNHHQDKTNKLLPLEKVRDANAHPRNLKTGSSKPRYYYFGSERPTVILGSVAFTMPERDFAAIIIDDHPIVGFKFEDGQALLQLALYDGQNNLVLQVVDNELVYSVDLWDVEWVGSVLTIRQQERDILLRTKFVPGENLVEIDRGKLQYNNVELEIWRDCLAVLNSRNIFGGFTIEAPIGLLIGHIPKRYLNQPLLHVPDPPREFDRSAAKKYMASQRKSLRQFENTV